MSKEVFLYKESMGLDASDLQDLRKCDLIPIKVDNFDDYKLMDPLSIAQSSDVFMAAIEAINTHSASSGSGPKALFGQILAGKILSGGKK